LTVNVLCDQRHAVGTTGERYRLSGSSGCNDRVSTTVRGVLTEDHTRCCAAGAVTVEAGGVRCVTRGAFYAHATRRSST
jgi:hypothetical protein